MAWIVLSTCAFRACAKNCTTIPASRNASKLSGARVTFLLRTPGTENLHEAKIFDLLFCALIRCDSACDSAPGAAARYLACHTRRRQHRGRAYSFVFPTVQHACEQ